MPGCFISHMPERGLYNDYGNIMVVELALKEDGLDIGTVCSKQFCTTEKWCQPEYILTV